MESITYLCLFRWNACPTGGFKNARTARRCIPYFALIRYEFIFSENGDELWQIWGEEQIVYDMLWKGLLSLQALSASLVTDYLQRTVTNRWHLVENGTINRSIWSDQATSITWRPYESYSLANRRSDYGICTLITEFRSYKMTSWWGSDDMPSF